MSKIGKQPVKIPQGITIKVEEGFIKISNDKNQDLCYKLLEGVKPILKEGEITFELEKKDKQSRSNWGTIRSLVNNAVEGLTKGFEKKLILEGVGYRMRKEGRKLVLSLGYSHPVEYEEPEGITFEVEERANTLTVKGFDKALVGRVAAEIRSLRKVEPYKGKGFRYENEVVRRKTGKRATTGAA